MLLDLESASALIDNETALFWFRRDLRINDNQGLYHALKENRKILPIFIFDSGILDLLENKSDARVEFIHKSLFELKTTFEKTGSSILVLYGKPLSIFQELLPKTVYTNHDYDPYAIQRDTAVAEIIHRHGGIFKSYKDQVILEKNEVVKENTEPYSVFTPYSKKWKATLTPDHLNEYPSQRHLSALKQTSPLPFPSLAEIGFRKTTLIFPGNKVASKAIENYATQRDFPSMPGTSKLGVHLRFGTISIRKAVQEALNKSNVWLNELIWREFYQMILWHFPHVVTRAFKPAYDRIKWRNDMKEFTAWCDGHTGYPIVDAGMRELNATGYMHNRVRMITASFLCKHLLIDWRWGEAYFAEKLIDYELASNNGGWQWCAGSGCDAAPYFRIFNPALQTKKFDPNFEYIEKWIPDVTTPNYPQPIVEHNFARARALKTYNMALKGNV